MTISPNVAAELRSLRDDYSDEIPSKIVHSDTPGYEYHKVRSAFFLALISCLENGIQEGQITSPELDTARKLIERFHSKEFGDQELTTAQDINDANERITKLIGL